MSESSSAPEAGRIAGWRALLVRFVQENGTSPGSRLARALGQEAQDVKDAYGTLGRFITREVPELRRAGTSGVDPTYALAPRGAAERANSTSAPETSLWRAWTSPYLGLPIRISKSGTPTVGAAEPGEGDAVILPPDTNHHRALARAFAETRAPRQRALLAPEIKDSERWWVGWNQALRRAGCSREWSQHRRDGLEASLRRSLAGTTLGAKAADSAFQAIASSRAVDAMRQRRSREGTLDQMPREELIGLLKRALDLLTDEELRRVWLPIGAFLAASNKREEDGEQ